MDFSCGRCVDVYLFFICHLTKILLQLALKFLEFNLKLFFQLLFHLINILRRLRFNDLLELVHVSLKLLKLVL